MDGLHLFKTAQRMALGDQLGNGTLVQCACDQQHYVVNHVAVSVKREKEVLEVCE